MKILFLTGLCSALIAGRLFAADQAAPAAPAAAPVFSDAPWRPPLPASFDGFALSGSGEVFKQAMHRPPAQPPAKPGG